MAQTDQSSVNITQTQLDILEFPLIVPASKLDADQYSADDLDGITESLVGSGNLAYGVLQASQTDALLMANEPFASTGNDSFDFGGTGNVGITAPASPVFNDENGPQGFQSNGSNTDIIRNAGGEGDSGFSGGNNGGGGAGNFTAGTVGSVSASQFSSDAGAFSPAGSGLGLGNGLDGGGLNGADGQNGSDGNSPDIQAAENGQDGADGADGNNGDGGGDVIHVNLGDTDINLGDIHIDLGDTTEIIDGLLIDLGDTITTLITEITNITDILGDVVTNLDINNLLDLTQIVTLVDNVTNNLTQTIDNTLTEITNITNNVTNILGDVLDGEGGLGDLVLNLDLNVLDTLTSNVNVPLGDLLDSKASLDANLTPAVNLTNNIADLTGLDVVSDTLGELGGTVNALQDTIDQVTDLVSDLDLNDPGATVDQLVEGLENLDNTAGEITGAIDDSVGGILDNLGIGDGGGPIGDGPLGELAEDIQEGLQDGLEGLEQGAEDIVNQLLDGLGDGGNGDEGVTSQIVDPIVSDVGDGLDVLTGGATENLTDAADTIVNDITDVADNVLGSVVGGLLGDGDDGGNEDEGVISQTLDPVAEDIGDVLDDVTGGASEDLTGTVTETVDAVSDVLDDLTGDLTDGLVGANNDNDGGADSDVTLDLGVDPLNTNETVEAALDPVEDIVGDIDLNVGLDTDLLGNTNETDNNAGDSDITVNTGIDLVDNTILGEGLDIPLDPVEEIVGDIDLDVDAAIDLLGGQADPLVNNGDGGTGEDTFAANLGDALGDTAESLLNGDSEGVSGGLTDAVDSVAGAAEGIVDDVASGIGDAIEDIVGDDNNILDDLLGDGDDGGNEDEGLISQTVDPVTEDIGDVLDDVTGGASEDLTDTVTETVDAVSDVLDDLTGDLTEGLLGDGDDGGNEDEGLISQTVDPVTEDIGDVLDDVTGGASEDLTDTVTETVDAVSDVLDDLTGDLTDGLLGANNDNDGGADSDVATNLDLGPLPLDETVEGALDPVEDLAGDLDLNVDAVTSLLDNSNTDNEGGDEDVVASPDLEVADTELLGGTAEVTLDPVEHLAGDLDVGVDAATDILGDMADPLVNDGDGGTGEDTILNEIGDGLADFASEILPGLNAGDAAEEDVSVDTDINILDENLVDTDLGSVLDPVEEIAGDIDTAVNSETDLFGDSETDNAAGDTDITADLDIDIGGEDIIDIPLDIPLDPIENITGDIDLDVSSALDLLNSDNPEETSGAATSEDETSWTESTIGEGGLFDDLVDGLGGAGDILPDPSGTVAEGLGILDVEPDIDLGSFGGLFG